MTVETLFHCNVDSKASRTMAVQAGIETDPTYGAITPPLYLSSNYSFKGFNQPRQYDYSRSGNPTRDLLANALAELEQGAGAMITSTGMSAVLLAINLLKAGDLLIAPHDCYGGTYRLFRHLADKGQFQLLFVDQNDPIALADAFSHQPAMIWLETPSNPLLRIVDIQKISQRAHKQNCLVVVDNTFLSPILQQPITLGADLVIHSTTKYINGHSDVVGGAVVAKNNTLFESIKWWANCLGITASPFDSFLTLRGLRTLHARIRLHQENTRQVLNFLQNHPQVATIYHPSLESHPNHLIAKKQQQDFGIMLSFELKCPSNDNETQKIQTFVESLKLFSLAESLGGVESLVCHPATMTHAAMEVPARETAGIKNNLIRLSIGIEDPNDLIADLQQAFHKAEKPIEKLKERHHERAFSKY